MAGARRGAAAGRPWHDAGWPTSALSLTMRCGEGVAVLGPPASGCGGSCASARGAARRGCTRRLPSRRLTPPRRSPAPAPRAEPQRGPPPPAGPATDLGRGAGAAHRRPAAGTPHVRPRHARANPSPCPAIPSPYPAPSPPAWLRFVTLRWPSRWTSSRPTSTCPAPASRRTSTHTPHSRVRARPCADPRDCAPIAAGVRPLSAPLCAGAALGCSAQWPAGASGLQPASLRAAGDTAVNRGTNLHPAGHTGDVASREVLQRAGRVRLTRPRVRLAVRRRAHRVAVAGQRGRDGAAPRRHGGAAAAAAPIAAHHGRGGAVRLVRGVAGSCWRSAPGGQCGAGLGRVAGAVDRAVHSACAPRHVPCAPRHSGSTTFRTAAATRSAASRCRAATGCLSRSAGCAAQPPAQHGRLASRGLARPEAGARRVVVAQAL
jgi:hypothetical protein